MKDSDNQLLDRGHYISNIRHILDNSDKYRRDTQGISADFPDKNFFALALNGQWGIGKTVLIRMLEDDYKFNAFKKPNYREMPTFIYYNAWSQDYYDEPLYSLVSQIFDESKNAEIARQLHKQLSSDQIARMGRESLEKILTEVLPNLLSGAKIKTPITIGGNPVELSFGPTQALVGMYKILKNLYKNAKRRFKVELPNPYKEKYDLIELLKKQLKQFAKIYNPIVVIDELDRCRPEYALKVLEIVKHIIDIDVPVGETNKYGGIKYIFALDINVLGKTLSRVYRNESVTSNYLIRFFDVIIDLKNTYSQSVKYVADALRKKSIDENLKYFIYELMKDFDLSLREINIILNHYKILCDCETSRFDKESDDAKVIILFFLAVKYKHPDKYEKIFDCNEMSVMKDIYTDRSQLIKEYLHMDLNRIDVPLYDLKNHIDFPYCNQKAIYFFQGIFAKYKDDLIKLRESLEFKANAGDPEAEHLYYSMYSKLTIRDFISFKLNN